MKNIFDDGLRLISHAVFINSRNIEQKINIQK